MRVPKSYYVIAILLLLAIASWAAFLQHQAPERRRAETEAFSDAFLSAHLPQQSSDFQLLLDNPSGAPVEAFPSLIGRQITMGPSEMNQIERRIQFYSTMALARNTMNHEGWKSVGEVRITLKADGGIVILQAYETSDGHLGFQQNDSYFRADGDNKGLLDFIHEARQPKAPQEHRIK